MKKVILTLMIASVSLMAIGQSLPNFSFENWQDAGTSAKDPVGWQTGNHLVNGFGLTVANMTADASHGDSAAELTSGQIGPPINISVPGALTNGYVALDQNNYPVFGGGSPYTGTPSSMYASFKYYPVVTTDTGAAIVLLTRWDTATKMKDTIGLGILDIYDTTSTYTQMKVDINYSSGATPDTVFILFLTSTDSTPNPGTKLFVDQVGMDSAVGFNTPMYTEKVDIYPNPAASFITIHDGNFQTGTAIRVYDIIGNEVLNHTLLHGKNEKINISKLAKGIYIYNILTNKGIIKDAGRIVKSN